MKYHIDTTGVVAVLLCNGSKRVNITRDVPEDGVTGTCMYVHLLAQWTRVSVRNIRHE